MMADWRPIETAPRDECVLLASLVFVHAAGRGPVWNITVGHWDAEFVFDWNEETDQTEYRGAWTDDTVASWGMEERTELHPTHWQPLPPPPEPQP